MFALDTNAISGLLAGDEALEALLGEDERHALPVIVLGEYRFGLLRSKEGKRLEALLQDLVAESTVLSVDESTAQVYASVREALRRKGRPLPENDVWISALARQHGLDIVSRDTHFDDVEGLVRHVW